MSWLSDDALARLRAAASAPDLAGTRYLLLGEVGRGGMSTVFLAQDPELGRRVALKVLDVPDESGELAERLVQEAQVLARLEHPGIAPVHEVGRLADGRVFYAMKYVEGPRLDAYAASGASISDRLRAFQRIAEAVAFAHDRGVLHRDLKPENVMVGPFGEVLVMDWGLAKVLARPAAEERAGMAGIAPALRSPQSTTTGHGAVLGTPGYMSPEQARGAIAEIDARSDVFALGAVLRFLLAGSAPDAAAPSSPPKPLLAICAKAMHDDKEQRYPSALALNADVARYLDGSRVEAHPEGLAHKAARVYRNHKIAFWLIVGYLVVRGSVLLVTGR
jgi:serine/threonine-protein kinase